MRMQLKQLHTNKYIDTWIKGTLVFVVSHLLILVLMAIEQKSFIPLNVFFILDLHLYFPALIESSLGSVLSFVLVASVFGIFYFVRKS